MDAARTSEEEAFYRHKHSVDADATEEGGALPEEGAEQQATAAEVESDGEEADKEASEAFLTALCDGLDLLEEIELERRRYLYSPERAMMIRVMSTHDEFVARIRARMAEYGPEPDPVEDGDDDGNPGEALP